MSDSAPLSNDTPTSGPKHGEPGITMYGADWCIDCRRAKDTFSEENVAYEWIDLEEDPSQADTAEAISGRKSIPVIVYPDNSHQVEPSPDEIRSKLQHLGLV
jgi:mycoredoxin